MFRDSEENKTIHKQDYFKGELKQAHSEILDLKEKLDKTREFLDLKNEENHVIKAEIIGLKKKYKHFRYYKEKSKEYKEKLKQASKNIQNLEIENNRELCILLIKFRSPTNI